jgi:DnaA family protein
LKGQLTLGMRLRDSSVFASYHAGPNTHVVEALQSAISGDGPMCLWLHGTRGVGKTHLLQAMCAAAGERGEPAAYLPLDELLSSEPDHLTGLAEMSFVCVDDVETAARNAPWERGLFNLYREVDERGGRLILASVAVPSAVPYELRDLASRLSASLVLTLQSLDDDGHVKALQLRARLRGFELPDESAQYLLRRLPREMGSLYAFLDQLDEASLVAQRRLTVPFVRGVIDARARDGDQ